MGPIAWLKRLVQRKGLGFSEPPFWAQESLRSRLLSSGILPNRETIGNDFEAYVADIYKADGVVFACMAARQMIFSEARFQWREFRDGQPGDLFGNRSLSILERPWQGGTTGELLAHMDADVSLSGNFYATELNGQVVRLRPDWVTIIIDAPSGNPWGLDARVVGYLYEPPNVVVGGQTDATVLAPSQVAHYSPIPDPVARFRGMSWLTPVIREILADKATTRHKENFFSNGATLQTVVKFDKETTPQQFDTFVEKFQEQHEGDRNAYKTLFLGGGADTSVVGTDLRQLDFKATQSAGENRIAAASGIHPVIVGLSDGLTGSSLNSGNFTAARRLTADKTMRPLWRMAAASLETLVQRPSGSAQLWYDDRDIAFLRDDQTDLAEVQQKQAIAIRNLVDAGYEPDAAIEFIRSNDLSRLLSQHSGLFSVQLQPPGANQDNDDTEPPAIGEAA